MLCLLCYLIPATKPSLILLQLVFVLVRATLVFVSCNPLMMDYVDRNSLGKASALSNMGSLIGDCFAMGFLVTITADMTHRKAFFITAVLIASLVLPLFFIIKEP
jgi:sugar phosphate permease